MPLSYDARGGVGLLAKVKLLPILLLLCPLLLLLLLPIFPLAFPKGPDFALIATKQECNLHSVSVLQRASELEELEVATFPSIYLPSPSPCHDVKDSPLPGIFSV